MRTRAIGPRRHRRPSRCERRAPRSLAGRSGRSPFDGGLSEAFAACGHASCRSLPKLTAVQGRGAAGHPVVHWWPRAAGPRATGPGMSPAVRYQEASGDTARRRSGRGTTACACARASLRSAKWGMTRAIPVSAKTRSTALAGMTSSSSPPLIRARSWARTSTRTPAESQNRVPAPRPPPRDLPR